MKAKKIGMIPGKIQKEIRSCLKGRAGSTGLNRI